MYIIVCHNLYSKDIDENIEGAEKALNVAF